jgi:hypothetical protein
LPAACFGATTVSVVVDKTCSFVPADPPKLTLVTLRKPLPVTVTVVPPPGTPAAGDTPDTAGGV